MNLINDYQPLIKNQAMIFARKYGVERDDLEQEGNLMLWQIQEGGMLGDNALAVSSYVKLRVIGAMQTYIAHNVGPVAVPNNAFWEHGERALLGPMDSVGESTNPEDEYLLKESAMEFSKKVKALKALLTPKEIAIFEGMIMAESPLTTREMADAIGVKSPQTVVNIRDRILERAKGVFDNG